MNFSKIIQRIKEFMQLSLSYRELTKYDLDIV